MRDCHTRLYNGTVHLYFLTGDVEGARGGPGAVADATLIRAVVGGFQLELPLRRLLQVRLGPLDQFAVAVPADFCQTRRVGPQDGASQGQHLVVPRASVLKDRAHDRRV